MTPDDVRPASAAIRADDWGDRAAWFRFAVTHPACRVVVAESDDGIVGTGVTTVNGHAAWIGTIWVATAWRGHGLGRALTETTIAAGAAAGARTSILVATDQGRPLYERLGFEVRSWYVTMEAPGRSEQQPSPARRDGDHPAVRAFHPEDLATMTTLDRGATGEDRGHLLAAFASPATTRVVIGADDRPAGFLVRPPWGGGATIAPAPRAALALLDDRRDRYPADRKVRAGVLAANEVGLERLHEDGWTEAWRAPRLELGPVLDWRPGSIWGQFNHALG